MRCFFILTLSAALLGGCLTTQENPNYEYSTTYKGDVPAQTQYAQSPYTTATTVAPTVVSYDSVPAQSYESVQSYENVQAPPAFGQASSSEFPMTASAPTDSVYGSSEVTGTPGYMAMQSANQVSAQSVTVEAATQPMPQTEFVSAAPLGAAGTPIVYDYSRNIVFADAATTGQQIPDSIRVIGDAAKNYTVQQGDTVYSLSRKTCVGVNVIQSMNGLDTDYAIKIGQSLTLPSTVC